MQRDIVRRLHTKESLSNALALATFLNDSRRARGFERVEKAIEQINRYDEITRKIEYKTAGLDGELRIVGEARQLQRQINDFLWQPNIRIQIGPSGSVRWIAMPPSDRRSPRPPSRAFIEGSALALDAVVKGYIRLVRQCPVCGTWFVAVKRPQKFCVSRSRRCREKAFRASPKGKAKRAEFMRNYRAGLKRRDSENLRVSTKKGGK